MSAAGKVNIIVSIVLGCFVAIITDLLGAEIAWLYGLITAGLACVGIAAVQIASISDSNTHSTF